MDRRRRRRTGEIGRIESAVVDRGQELLLRAAGGRDFTSDTGPSIFFALAYSGEGHLWVWAH